MANILISYYSESGEAMYDAVSEVLLNNGNSVFRLNINNNYVHMTSWGDISKVKDEKLLSLIKDFRPDVVLNYNNSLPLAVEHVLGKDCINCLIDADNANYFWNKKNIYKDKTSFVYVGLQSASKEVYEKFLDCSLDDMRYIYVPGATTIRNSSDKPNKNITFIGTNFHLFEMPYQSDYYSEQTKKLYDDLKSNYYTGLNYVVQNYPEISDPKWTLDAIQKTVAGQIRLKCLQALTDLGLTIYGVRWDNIAYYDYELAKCISHERVKTIEENQNVYNTSKISINISHPQATTNFSWRVMDIMASNACLLTEYKKDWVDLFGQYLSNETIESIIYKDQYDLREKVQKLLADEDLRKKCVTELNTAIEKNGRWEKRFSDLGKFIGVKLTGNDGHNLSYVCISNSNYVPSNKEILVVKEQPVAKVEQVKENNPVRKKNILQNGIYKVSHVPAIRKYLKDILEP